MKKTKAVSLLLSLSMMMSLTMPGTFAMPTAGAEKESGLKLNKTATKNDDGTYNIKLEAYVTGNQVITSGKDMATDIVLVLDQSGSMKDPMPTYGFKLYSNKTNENYYELRHNGGSAPNLYYSLGDGVYASVSVDSNQYRYIECTTDWLNSAYYEKKDDLCVETDRGYEKVSVRRDQQYYTYTFPDGTRVQSWGSWNSPDDFEGKGPLYYRVGNQGVITYSYTYTDQSGNSQTIGSSEGRTTKPDFPLYEKYTVSTTTRIVALKTAVTSFVDNVKSKAIRDNVNHRIAVVGFASNETGNTEYENSEVFVGSNQYNYNGNRWAGATSSDKAEDHYYEALQDMRTQSGYDNVIASKNNLASSGATFPELGLEMAKGILDANPISGSEQRTRVVILFTDGAPGKNSNNFSLYSADRAIAEADNLRADNVIVYSVGIFGGADATSLGNRDGNYTEKSNWFMQNVSDNKGELRNPGYYLSAADSGTLNTIFKKISDQIEGGASTTLDEKAVIKDIIAPSFEFSGDGDSDITLWTESYKGDNKWEKDSEATSARASIEKDDKGIEQVEVNNFDFSENWCGKVTTNGAVSYRGKKLVISFNVKPKDGFLGGNDVPTNTEAGIYKDAGAGTPLEKFPVPTVNVGINNIVVNTPDKNVYLLGTVSASELRSGTATVGGVTLKLNEKNYGLEGWQYAYVGISVVIENEKGDTVEGDLTGLTEDSRYTVSVTITPNTNGTKSSGDPVPKEGISGSDNGNINVFKPKLTFKDGEAWYGDNVPNNDELSKNLVEEATKWLHGTTEADTSEMGRAPQLDLTCTPDQTGTINTKQDVPVDVQVAINGTSVTEHTRFEHQKCEGKTCELPENREFLLHIKTCQLTITKTGENIAKEPYVFTVYKDGKKYSEVTIVGSASETIYELPVGTYTVTEDEGWSWRYNLTDHNSATLAVPTPEKPQSDKGEIICTNTKTTDKWLNGFSSVVKNVFQTAN